MFDLQGPIDLLGPEEVDNLLSELVRRSLVLLLLDTLSLPLHHLPGRHPTACAPPCPLTGH